MKNSRICLLAAAFLVTGFLAQGAPEDTYAEADSLICLAKMLEGNKAYADAHKNAAKAVQTLNSLKSSSPNWKPDWVERKLAAAQEAEERLAPLAKENPDAKADLWKAPDYSVAPAPPSKESNVEESLKPTMNAALGYRAPVEVMEGSPHAAYVESDPHYAQYQKNLRVQSRSRQKSLRSIPNDSRSVELDRIRQQQDQIARQQESMRRNQGESHNVRNRFAPVPATDPAVQARAQVLAAEQIKLQERERQLEQERRQAAVDAERNRREAAQRQEASRQQQIIDAQRRQQQIQQQQQARPVSQPQPAPQPAPSEGRRSRFRIG